MDLDPEELVTRSCLPAHAAILSAASVEAYDGVDRISALPDDLLRIIVSGLPIKDAVSTTVLSTRWVSIWRSAPLVFYDEHLTSSPESTRVAAVDCTLSSHPGPFRAVHLSSIQFCQRHLDEWPPLLLDKDVQDLVFVSSRRMYHLKFPPNILSFTHLRRLYLGSLDLPDQASSCAGKFPYLKELVIINCTITQNVLDYILDSSPMLEVFGLVHILQNSLIVRLRGENLQCVNIFCFLGGQIIVSGAPCLERFMAWKALPPADSNGSKLIGVLKVTVDASPKVLGYLDAGLHVLRIGDIFVKREINVGPSTKIWSVRILALTVNFGVLRQVKTMTCWLRCFPNVEILHFQSAIVNRPSDEQYTEFYEDLDLIGCVHSQIKKVVLHDFRCSQSELTFLKYILRTANWLKIITLVKAKNAGGAMEAQLNDLAVIPWGSQACSISLFEDPENEFAPRQVYGWNFQRAADPSVDDPFDLMYGNELLHFSKD